MKKEKRKRAGRQRLRLLLLLLHEPFQLEQIRKFAIDLNEFEQTNRISCRRKVKCSRTKRARFMCARAPLWMSVVCWMCACHIKNSSDLNLHAKLNWVFDSIEFCFSLSTSPFPSLSRSLSPSLSFPTSFVHIWEQRAFLGSTAVDSVRWLVFDYAHVRRIWCSTCVFGLVFVRRGTGGWRRVLVAQVYLLRIRLIVRRASADAR